MTRIVHILSFLIATASANAGESPASLLARGTWSFAAAEVEQLNVSPLDELETPVLAAEAEARGAKPMGQLMTCKFVDLDGDGTVEILASIDLSGRRLSRDIILLSRKDGVYIWRGVPDYGIRIEVWRSCEGETFIVGQEPVFELSRVDPLTTYPILYSWTGQKIEDASRRAREYFEQVYAPAISTSIAHIADNRAATTQEETRRRVLAIIGLARSALKVNALFDSPVVSPSEMGILRSALDASRPDINSINDPVVAELLVDTDARLGTSP